MATTPVTPPAGEQNNGPSGSPTHHPSATPVNGIPHDEVERRIAEARREEKGKLYADLERLRKDGEAQERKLKDLQTALETAQSEGRRTQTLEKQIETLQGQMTAASDKFSKALDDALENQNKQFEETRRKDRLETQRNTLLASAQFKVKAKNDKGEDIEIYDYELIPEMVTGETPEELQTNFNRSRERYKQISERALGRAKDELGAPLREALPQSVTPGTAPGASGSPSGNDGGLENWRRMPATEWEAKKKTLKEQAFKDAGLPMKQR